LVNYEKSLYPYRANQHYDYHRYSCGYDTDDDGYNALKFSYNSSKSGMRLEVLMGNKINEKFVAGI
jgi:hypothetical protein